jgi:hypothetical protein
MKLKLHFKLLIIVLSAERYHITEGRVVGSWSREFGKEIFRKLFCRAHRTRLILSMLLVMHASSDARQQLHSAVPSHSAFLNVGGEDVETGKKKEWRIKDFWLTSV